jgi:[acyl-carrier-protein] S-malonyltransferase
MNTRNAALFAGQGAQAVGMGKDLADAFPECKALFDRADDILGYRLSEVVFGGPEERLTKTDVCQPAIFVSCAAAFTALRKLAPEVSFGAMAGLSLGEWTALWAGGAVSFEDAVRVLEARGRFMQEACEATPSGMIAIVGATPAQLDALCSKTGCTPANINSAAQVVLSGDKAQIAAAATTAKELGIKRAIPLQTAGAFHSKFMQPAREKLAPVLDGITFSAPKFPVISNVTGQVHSSDPGEIKATMLEQVTGTTNWAADVEAAKSLGCDSFVEFGPGKVLSGLVKKIDPALQTTNVADLASLDATVAALA